MRHILITLLLVIPFVASAGHHYDWLEGYWDNTYLDRTVKIKAKSYGLKIKSLYRNKKWSKFRYDCQDQLKDRNGNIIRILSHNRIEFINTYTGHAVTFHRHRDCPNYDRYDHGHYDEYYDDYGYRNTDRKRRRSKRKYKSEHSNPQVAQRLDEKSLYQLEGTYAPQGYGDRRVVILSTRDGIKVKDKRNGQWFRYRLSADGYALINDKGHRYQLLDGRLVWLRSADAKALQLNKISGDTL